MPILTLTVDTDKGTMEVAVDGASVENASEVSAYCYSYGRDSKEATFNVGAYDKVGEVSRVTRLYAAESSEAKDAVASGAGKPSEKYKGVVEVAGLTKAQESIAKFLTQR